MDRVTELLKYDEYWHRYDGRISETSHKSLCGKVFEVDREINNSNYYICNLLENFMEIPICPNCLDIWLEKEECDHSSKCGAGRFEVNFTYGNHYFIKHFIEYKGYDKFNLLINNLIESYVSLKDTEHRFKKL